MTETITVNGNDVFIDGCGEETIVMLHGWPDTYRLWQPQVDHLKRRYRCVRFSLPGYEKHHPRTYYDLDAVLSMIDSVVEAVGNGKPVTLLLHDWGCVYGYQYYMRNQAKVKRIIGVDVGDAGSPDMTLSTKAKLVLVSYQLWLMAAWNIGGRIGDWMTRKVATLFNAPAPSERVHSGMTYSYHWRWSSTFMRRPLGTKPLDIQVPFLFIYGGNKVGNFHSKPWQTKMAEIEGNQVIELPTHHWVMVEQPDAFNEAVMDWLIRSETSTIEEAREAS